MTKQQNYNDKQQEQNQYQYSSGSSTTTRNTDPGVLLLNMQLEQLVRPYEDVFGRGIPSPIGQYFVRLMRAGMEPGVIASAINATAWARVPTPYYMRAILQRYLAEGIMTEAQLNHDRMEQDTRRHAQVEEKEESMYF